MIKVDEGQANINVKVAPESQIAVGIEPKKKIEVIVGDAARMDCQRAINYIKSGEAEIDAYVDGTAKPAIDSYVNTTSKAAIDSYVTNTAIPQVDSYVSLAKQWAIGDPTEPVGNSAKYWAEEAATTVSNMANKDLSNLSATGEAKFDAKQDVISDLSTIRSGAALGATAVQSVTTGTANGTIKVDGNSVSVHGLGSAAYTASTDYDAAGSASTAETNAKNYADSLASNYATSAQGEKADSALQSGDNVSELVNDAGYITSSALSGYATESYVDTADQNLQGQIDAIVASSDVFDIVGTYAELQAYDISTVPVNDIIKVLVDSTHENAATYYRCVETGGVKSWSYIGTEGAYYTKAQSDARFATAAQGALADTAVQPADLATVATSGSYNDLLNKPTIPDTTYMVTTNTAQTISANKTFHNAELSTDNMITLNGSTSFLRGLKGIEYRNLIKLNSSGITAGSINEVLTLNGSGTRPKYNSSDVALYSDIPTVNDGKLALQVNSTDIGEFTANQSSDTTINISVPTDTGDLTNGAGFITGITSGDVTTALGYTPYSDANPNGYTSNVGTVTSVNNTSPDGNGNVTLSIPAAQVNSDWNAVSGVAEILNKPTIPTVNDATITITQGGVTKGSFTLNQATGDTIALDAGGGGGGSYTAGTGIDITSNVISVTSPTLTNGSTANWGLSLLNTQSYAGCITIGDSAQASSSGYSTAVGHHARATGRYSSSLGAYAYATAASAIQLGYGTNSEANSFYVATSTSNNWKMLGNDGLIPSGRIPISTSVDSTSTNSTVVGAKLFYDTCGDIETLINAL